MKNDIELKIYGMKVKVEYSDPSDWGVGAMGRVNCKTAKISIAKDMPEDIMACTLLHEIFHFIDDSNNLELTETQITSLSTGLFGCLRDNPELIEKIKGLPN